MKTKAVWHRPVIPMNFSAEPAPTASFLMR